MPTLDPNNPEWKGFAAQMRKEPGCDAHREVFADFVEERGGEAFANFIRTMIAVAKVDPTNQLGVNNWSEPRLIGQKDWKRYADAERYFRSCWGIWSPVNKLSEEAKKEWRFHRGFPDKVVLDWHGLKWLDTLIAIGPVGEVEVVNGSPVTWEIFPNTIHWSIAGDPLAARCKEPVFVTERGSGTEWMGHTAMWNRGLVTQASTRFLEIIWGKQVTRIWYSNRPNVQVWPTVPGQGVLLPWQGPPEA